MKLKFFFLSIVLSLFMQLAPFMLFAQDKPKNPTLEESVFSIRDKKVFVGNTLVDKADAESFQILNALCHGDEDKHCFGKDKNRVYYYSREIPNSDPITFKLLGEGYSSDKKNVYYIMENIFLVIKGANSKSFEVVGSSGNGYSYAKDKNFAYYDGVQLKGSDGKSFTLIQGEGKYNAKDKKNYYKGSQVIPIKQRKGR